MVLKGFPNGVTLLLHVSYLAFKSRKSQHKEGASISCSGASATGRIGLAQQSSYTTIKYYYYYYNKQNSTSIDYRFCQQ